MITSSRLFLEEMVTNSTQLSSHCFENYTREKYKRTDKQLVCYMND